MGSASIGGMFQDLASDLERHLLTAVLVSGVLALVIVAAFGVAWWRGRRWVRDRGTGARSTREPLHFSQGEGPPTREAGGSNDESGASREDQPAARLVREAAARAAGLRSAWDRAYEEARGSTVAPVNAPTSENLAALMAQLLREQQQTNELLRELLSRTPKPGS